MSEVDSDFLRLPQVAGYDVLRPIGRGGVAVVYLARQRNLERLVALKEVSQLGPSDPELARRSLDEARLMGSLNHPNIVTVHDYLEQGGTPYLSMEYLARGSLRPLAEHLNTAQTIRVLADVLAGLTAAHARRIVHRDLKPENLLVTDDGRVKITDFGIAKAVDRLTQSKTETIGTPTYMAPEQAMGQPVAPVTDLYSLGVIAYELTVGVVPFESDTAVSLLLRHVKDAPRPPRSVKPDLDPEFAEWIERLLVKSPEERMPTARASQELQEIALRLLGPRWLWEAALPELDTPDPSRHLTYDPRPRPDTAPEKDATPGPSEPSRRPADPEPEAPPQTTPGPAADLATVPPRGPADVLDSGAPRAQDAAPPRRGRTLAAALGLLAVAVAVAVGVGVYRSTDNEPAATTPNPSPSPMETMRFTTRAFTMQVPAGWTVECRDKAETCGRDTLPIDVHRSALSGDAPAGLTIDRGLVRDDRASVSLTDIITRVRRELARSSYSIVGQPQAVTLGGRSTRRLSLESATGARVTIYAFKAGGDIYVISAKGSDRATSEQTARIAARSLEPL